MDSLYTKSCKHKTAMVFMDNAIEIFNTKIEANLSSITNLKIDLTNIAEKFGKEIRFQAKANS